MGAQEDHQSTYIRLSSVFCLHSDFSQSKIFHLWNTRSKLYVLFQFSKNIALTRAYFHFPSNGTEQYEYTSKTAFLKSYGSEDKTTKKKKIYKTVIV